MLKGDEEASFGTYRNIERKQKLLVATAFVIVSVKCQQYIFMTKKNWGEQKWEVNLSSVCSSNALGIKLVLIQG